jgi:cobalt-zinc-cadmium efflux system protein
MTAHSLTVLAAGGDYLLDAAGAGVALLAIRLSARPLRSVRRDGALKASSVAALVNSGCLLVLEVLVAAAAVDRLISGISQVRGLPVLIVSGIAALVVRFSPWCGSRSCTRSECPGSSGLSSGAHVPGTRCLVRPLA